MKTKLWIVMLLAIISVVSLAACSGDTEKATDHSQMNHGDDSSKEENSNVKETNKDEFRKEPSQFNENANQQLMTLNTKNVTRLNTNNAIEGAVFVSQTIFPATEKDNQPNTVILVQENDWQTGLAAADLIHHPNNGPILFMTPEEIPTATLNEIKRLNPLGNSEGTQVMIMGDVTESILQTLEGYKVETLSGKDAPEMAAKIDDKYAQVSGGEYPESVIIVSAEEEAKLSSLVAVNWIAHMPESILFVSKDKIPQETINALQKRKSANIYILGSEEIISKTVEKQLQDLGKVTRIAGENPAQLSVEFAKFKDDINGFGWGLTEPGHGVSFISSETPSLAIAAAPFSHLGKHAPLIWLDKGEVTNDIYSFLSVIKPTFKNDPTTGPYNHGFIVGTEENVSYRTQGILDNKLEIVQEEGKGHSGH